MPLDTTEQAATLPPSTLFQPAPLLCETSALHEAACGLLQKTRRVTLVRHYNMTTVTPRNQLRAKADTVFALLCALGQARIELHLSVV
jgi:hypothetical protein